MNERQSFLKKHIFMKNLVFPFQRAPSTRAVTSDCYSLCLGLGVSLSPPIPLPLPLLLPLFLSIPLPLPATPVFRTPCLGLGVSLPLHLLLPLPRPLPLPQPHCKRLSFFVHIFFMSAEMFCLKGLSHATLLS